MNWAQKSVSPTRATPSTPVSQWPVRSSSAPGGGQERLPGVALLGGLLIVIAVVVSELKVRRPREATEARDVQNEGEQANCEVANSSYAL